MRGTALAEGIGERLTSLPALPRCYVLIGKPSVSVSTKMAYESLDLTSVSVHPDIDGMIRDIQAGDLTGIVSRMGNVFEPGIQKRYPVIGDIRRLMEEYGAMKAMMSGSGPTVFGIFQDAAQMEKAAAALRDSHLAKVVFATEVYNRNGGTTNDK